MQKLKVFCLIKLIFKTIKLSNKFRLLTNFMKKKFYRLHISMSASYLFFQENLFGRDFSKLGRYGNIITESLGL